jgi:hypothetical protein
VFPKIHGSEFEGGIRLDSIPKIAVGIHAGRENWHEKEVGHLYPVD